jgi:hypothetical protein
MLAAPAGLKAEGICLMAQGFDTLTAGAAAMQDVIVVREWDANSFHRRVLELEAQGYEARRDTYRISPEMNPETGNIVHLHTIEMSRSHA